MYKILISLIFIIFSLKNSHATGPSYIYSEIKPVSVNQAGQVLCKTRFIKNEWGEHRSMKVQYGYCILFKDRIIQFSGKTLDPELTESKNYYKQLEFWDSIFYSKTDSAQLQEIISVVLNNKYEFTEYNIDSFFINKIIKLTEFEKEYNVNLKNNYQRGLYSAKSIKYYNNKIHVLFDFGGIILVKNCNSYSYAEHFQIGAEFDYSIIDSKRVPYEESTIVGVFFVRG